MNYKHGDWYAICDQCGRRAFASQMTKRWDNKMVHKDPSMGCFETRHPQDFVRAVGPDPKPLPWTRPDSDGIEPTLAINCDAHYFVDIPYLIEADQTIYKGYTLAPASGVLIQNGATVTVHCTWIID